MARTSENRNRVFREDTLDAYQDCVERSIQLMYAHLGESLTIDDLADAAFMSRFHFSRVFLQVTAVSPGRFLAAIRMQEAKRLLMKTDCSVTEVALDVGYNSLGTFIRIFADFVGFPPIRFRQLAVPLRSLPLSAVTSLLPCRPIGAGFTGELECTIPLALAVVATFPSVIPRSHPSECVLCATSRFAFVKTLEPGARIFAVGIVPGATVEDAILATDERIVIGAEKVRGAHSEIRIVLRSQERIDPPIVVAFPLLIAESLVASQMSNLGEVLNA